MATPYVNQFGQPCDSLGNPLVPVQAGQPQPPVVYVNAPPPQYNSTAYAPAPAAQAPAPVAYSGAAAPAVQVVAPAAASTSAAVGSAGAWQHGRIVVLQSVASGKSLRITDEKGHIEGRGAQGAFAQWKVHVVSGAGGSEPIVKLQSMKFDSHYLRIGPEGGLNGNGNGGEWTEFKVIVHNDNSGTVSLQSVKHGHKAGMHVGILPDGSPKAPKETGQGPHGRFTPIWIK